MSLARLSSCAGLLLLVACNGRPAAAPLSQRCPVEATYDGARCVPFNSERTSLEQGAAELEAFHPEVAMGHLKRAQSEGPYRHADFVRLYEQLGVAHAYLEDEASALRAFDAALLLSPGHAISYTLSPKATFAFQKARAAAADRRAPEMRVSWPRDATVDAPLLIDVAVTSDPAAHFSRARLFHRRRGTQAFAFADFDLRPAPAVATIELPPVAPDAGEATALELFLVVHDRSGNEVHLWGDAAAPNAVPLAFVPELRWYERWWVWAITGTVVAAAASLIVLVAASPAPETLEGEFKTR